MSDYIRIEKKALAEWLSKTYAQGFEDAGKLLKTLVPTVGLDKSQIDSLVKSMDDSTD